MEAERGTFFLHFLQLRWRRGGELAEGGSGRWREAENWQRQAERGGELAEGDGRGGKLAEGGGAKRKTGRRSAAASGGENRTPSGGELAVEIANLACYSIYPLPIKY